MKFYITDHTLDKSVNLSNAKNNYKIAKNIGFNLVRYDFRWNKIQPKINIFNYDQLKLYVDSIRLMVNQGLEAPIIIISSIPNWALEMYRNGKKDDFFRFYEEFVFLLANTIKDNGHKIKYVQVLNEWNNPIYTKVSFDDLSKLCDITRNCFEYTSNFKIKIIATVIISNIGDILSYFGFGIGTSSLLPKMKSIKKCFDVIGIDYYPGLWHFPINSFRVNRESMFSNVNLLKAVFEEISDWGVEYDLAETGLSSNWPSSEEIQSQFYQIFFGELRKLLIDFARRGKRLPSRVGLYELQDEIPNNLFGLLLKTISPYPEYDFGIMRADGEFKLVSKKLDTGNINSSILGGILKKTKQH